MNILIIYILFFILIFSVLYNLFNVRVRTKLDKFIAVVSSREYIDSYEKFNTQKSLSDRVRSFLRGNVEKYVKDKKIKDEDEIIKCLYKIYKGKMSYIDFQVKRISVSILSGCFMIVAYIMLHNTYFLLGALAVPFALYYLYKYDLKNKVKKIDWENFVFFPEVLTSLAMVYRTGSVSTIFVAFEKVAKIYKHPLVDEIQKSVDEYKSNKNKYDVLRDLKDRVDFPDFNSFITLIMESEKNGIRVADSISERAQAISNKRKILAIAQLKRIPTKMEFIMLFAGLYITFVYMIAPSLIMAFQNLKGVN